MLEQDFSKTERKSHSSTSSSGINKKIDYFAILLLTAIASTLCFLIAIYNFYFILEGVGTGMNAFYTIMYSLGAFFISRTRIK